MNQKVKDTSEKIKKFEESNVTMFKAGNGKSVTVVVNKEDFPEKTNELVLNVSLKGLKAFLDDERFKAFRFNRIREV